MWLIIIFRPLYPEIHWVKLCLNECLISYSGKDKKYNSNRNIGHWPRCPQFYPTAFFLPSQSGFSKMEYIFHLKCKTDYICLPYNLSVSNRRFHKIRNGPKISLEFLFSSWGLGSVSHLVRLWQYFWFDCLIDDWIWWGLAQITF